MRTFSTHRLIDGVLGWGWSHSLDVKLYESSTSSQTFRLSQGGVATMVMPYQRIIDNDSGGTYENMAVLTGSWVSTSGNSGFIGPNWGA